jgi:pterin-4a-carbinolamine dehydratase
VERTYRFSDVQETLAFVREIGEVAQREGRQPETSFDWRYVTVSLPANTIGDSRATDIITAKIDRVAWEMASRASA